MDLSFVSNEARQIHDFFVSIFYALSTVLLLVGVLTEFFKIPLGGAPTFTQLIGRVFVAAILLVAYPEISNAVAAVADSISDKIGSLNTFQNVLSAAGKTLKDYSFSWTSIGDTLISAVAYLAYLVLYITVFFFDAAIAYCMLLLYIFSPIMIAFFILPQTASLTSGLFRTLFEIAAWKIVFSVLGTLLWSTALSNFTHADSSNFITLIVLTLILAFSLITTPMVVKSLISGALASSAAQSAAMAGAGLSAGILTPAALTALTTKTSALAYKGAAKGLSRGTRATFKGVGQASKAAQSRFARKVEAGTPSEDSPE